MQENTLAYPNIPIPGGAHSKGKSELGRELLG